MDKRTFEVSAIWDGEAKVYYSKSDIIGLHIEAATLDEFEVLLMEFAPELVIANHVSKQDLARKSLAELVPAILWRRPDPAAAA
jgi:hypothetical protein